MLDFFSDIHNKMFTLGTVPAKPFHVIFMEACIVGVCLIGFTYIAGYLARQMVQKPSLPEICSTWNQHRIMEINLFLAGFLFHFMFEYLGINKWYVDHYYDHV
jgi:hypothetical protein